MIQQRRTTGTPTPLPPPDLSMVFEAVAEAAVVAERYSHTAAEFAAIGDMRGLSYAIRCAAKALETAASLAEELRPSHQGGRAA